MAQTKGQALLWCFYRLCFDPGGKEMILKLEPKAYQSYKTLSIIMHLWGSSPAVSLCCQPPALPPCRRSPCCFFAPLTTFPFLKYLELTWKKRRLSIEDTNRNLDSVLPHHPLISVHIGSNWSWEWLTSEMWDMTTFEALMHWHLTYHKLYIQG